MTIYYSTNAVDPARPDGKDPPLGQRYRVVDLRLYRHVRETWRKAGYPPIDAWQGPAYEELKETAEKEFA